MQKKKIIIINWLLSCLLLTPLIGMETKIDHWSESDNCKKVICAYCSHIFPINIEDFEDDILISCTNSISDDGTFGLSLECPRCMGSFIEGFMLKDIFINKTDEKVLLKNFCEKCTNKDEEGIFSFCARCQKIKYCSKECQVKDWPYHKQACVLLSQKREEIDNYDTLFLRTFSFYLRNQDIEMIKLLASSSYISIANRKLISNEAIKALLKKIIPNVEKICASCNDEAQNANLKCGKCFSVYYCSKECQKSNWQQHKKNCKKKRICTLCKNICKQENSKCGQCLLIHYCSKECQKQDWKNHKLVCQSNEVAK